MQLHSNLNFQVFDTCQYSYSDYSCSFQQLFLVQYLSIHATGIGREFREVRTTSNLAIIWKPNFCQGGGHLFQFCSDISVYPNIIIITIAPKFCLLSFLFDQNYPLPLQCHPVINLGSLIFISALKEHYILASFFP